MKTVLVKFDNANATSWQRDKTYSYLCPDHSVQEGDHVVVDTPSGGYTCVRVTGVEDGALPAAKKEIICRVDDSAYKARLDMAKEREKLLKELAAIDKKVKDGQRFAYLAQLDPEAAKLLERLDVIDKAV
jgi:hypothetical protein